MYPLLIIYMKAGVNPRNFRQTKILMNRRYSNSFICSLNQTKLSNMAILFNI